MRSSWSSAAPSLACHPEPKAKDPGTGAVEILRFAQDDTGEALAPACGENRAMLVLTQLSLRRGVKLVLDRASVTIQPGEKVGLVGRNGAGKSSLFSLLAGRLHADAGDVVDAAALAHRRGRAGDARDRRGRDRLRARRATRASPKPRPRWPRAEASDDGHAMADAHQAISDAGGFDARPRAQAMLLGLGFKSRRARRAGEQLLRRLAHAPAARARADVPGRPDAARRADQPPRPRRAGLARGLAAALRRAR